MTRWMLVALGASVVWLGQPAAAEGQTPVATVEGRVPSGLAPCGGTGLGALEVAFVAVPEGPALHASICDWFREAPWRVNFVVLGQLPARGSAGELAPTTPRIAVTRASAEQVRLFLDVPGTRAESSQRWVRRIPLDNGLDDVGVEVIAQTLHSLAQAALPATDPSDDLGSAREAERHPGVASSLGDAGWEPLPESSMADAKPRGSAAAASAPEGTPVPSAPQVSRAPRTRAGSRPRAAQALVARAALGVAVQRPAELEESSQRSSFEGPRLRVGLGYQLYARGPEPVTHGPLVRAEVDWSLSGWSLGAFARAGYFSSKPVINQGLELGLSGTSFALGAAANTLFSPFSARLAAAGGVDLPELDVRVLDPQALRQVADGEPRARSFVGMEAGLVWRSGELELALHALARWLFLASHYEVLRAGERETLLRPWRLQPGVALEVAYVW